MSRTTKYKTTWPRRRFLKSAAGAGALAMLDALVPAWARDMQVVTIRGDSYRLREKRRSGLLQKPPASVEKSAVMATAGGQL